MYTVSWYYNGRLYIDKFDTLIQAMVRLWKLNDNNSATISKE